MRGWRWNVTVVLLVGVLLYLQYRLWFEAGGIRDMLKLKKALTVQMEKTENFKKRNEELLTQIQHLQTSKEATEARARNELGMVKKGETFYQVVK